MSQRTSAPSAMPTSVRARVRLALLVAHFRAVCRVSCIGFAAGDRRHGHLASHCGAPASSRTRAQALGGRRPVGRDQDGSEDRRSAYMTLRRGRRGVGRQGRVGQGSESDRATAHCRPTLCPAATRLLPALRGRRMAEQAELLDEVLPHVPVRGVRRGDATAFVRRRAAGGASRAGGARHASPRYESLSVLARLRGTVLTVVAQGPLSPEPGSSGHVRS